MLFALLLQIAAPPSPPGFVIAAGCSGGVAGRSEKAELASDGRVSGSRGWTAPIRPVTTVTPALARALSSQLDRAKFDTLPSLPGRAMPDSITCSITRTGATTHAVQFVSSARRPSDANAQRYRDVRAVLGLILAAADVPHPAK